MLNYIWLFFFVVAFIMAIVGTFTGAVEVWSRLMNTTFEAAQRAFEICLGLTGVLTFWLGLMKIGEQGGVIAKCWDWTMQLLRWASRR